MRANDPILSCVAYPSIVLACVSLETGESAIVLTSPIRRVRPVRGLPAPRQEAS